MKTKRVDQQRAFARKWLCGACCLVLLAGAAPQTAAKRAKHKVEATRNQGEIPEESLLDVGIQVLGPGLPDNEDALFDLELEGVYEDVRKSEARYIAVRLLDTLQSTGFWGAVRVVPAGTYSLDVAIGGKIVESTGKRLVLDLLVVDASGRVWLEQRYKQLADPRAYRDSKDGIVRQPFQSLYNRIANDLLAARNKLKDSGIRDIRAISQLRFAIEVLPAAFADYLEVNRKGRTVVTKLPAADDPMMERIARIREREYMFIDTLTEYYVNFSAQMDESYRSWRQFSYEEQLVKQKLTRQARGRKVLGALAIAGGVVAAAEGGEAGAALAEPAILVGTMAIESGIAKSKEAKLHVEALRELASSFNSEVEPLLVEVEGQNLRLTGSIETQYATWRQLLREILTTQTGVPLDPDDISRLAAETEN